MHNQHRSPDPTKIERATATSTVALFFYISFLLFLLDAFSSRFFNTNVLFLYTLYSSFFFWCLVQSGLFLFLKLACLCYSSTALAGGYSCVTLTLT